MSDDGDNIDEFESLIPYDQWMIDGMRRIIYLSIWQAAEFGLPGEHHFYVTFKTNYPGVYISPSLKARFPEEMKIVIQHQFQNLEADEEQFSISLQFGGVPETLVVPYNSISQFVDPAVHFGLDFEVDWEAAKERENSDKTGGPRLVNTDGNVAHIGPAKTQKPSQAQDKAAASGSKTKYADTASSASPAGGSGTTDDRSGDKNAGTDDAPKVVTLDAFRQRKKDSNNE